MCVSVCVCVCQCVSVTLSSSPSLHLSSGIFTPPIHLSLFFSIFPQGTNAPLIWSLCYCCEPFKLLLLFPFSSLLFLFLNLDSDHLVWSLLFNNQLLLILPCLGPFRFYSKISTLSLFLRTLLSHYAITDVPQLLDEGCTTRNIVKSTDVTHSVKLTH